MLSFHAISHRDGDDRDGIHLIWSPPWPTGYALDGFTIDRRLSRGQRRLACFVLLPGDLNRAIDFGFVETADATIWASPADPEQPGSKGWLFRLALKKTHSMMRIIGPGAIGAFAARADGKVIDGRRFTGSTCELRGNGITTLWLIVQRITDSFQVCGDTFDNDGWAGAKRIASDLQVPFQVVNGAVTNIAEEKALAQQRATPGTLEGEFEDVSEQGNSAYAKPFELPAWKVINQVTGAEHDQWDIAPLGLLLTAGAASPAWQRALGFAHLDQDDLTPGQSYDYRITGKISRADRDEQCLDFQTVPSGTTVPTTFRLNDVWVYPQRPAVVEAEQGVNTPVTLWKGIRFDKLQLVLGKPADRIAIRGKSISPVTIRAYSRLGEVANFNVTITRRTVLDFGADAERIVIIGSGFFAGVIPEPIADTLDPKEPVPIEEFVYDVRFEATSRPARPSSIVVDNLGSASRAARRQQRDDTIGFEITWMPPLSMDAGLLQWWPANAVSAPPTDVARYVLERQWDGQPFAPMADTDGRFMASRGKDPVTDVMTLGVNLLDAFPPANRSGIAALPEVRAIEGFEGDDPAFGTMVTYLVQSVDAIGRRSDRRVADPAQLQKLTRPPVPIAPPGELPGSGGTNPLVTPAGVQARLLQSNDEDLTTEEQTRVESEGEIVVLRWGWGPEQRELDPHVTEFRVYEYDGRLSEIRVTVNSSPVPGGGGGWDLQCTFSRAVGTDEFAGNVIVLGHAYVIASHGAGTSSVLSLEPAVVDALAAPVGTGFALVRLDGSEAEPSSWDTRVTVVPKQADPADPQALEEYALALPATWIAVTPAHRRQFRTFGVTAADSESYVQDTRQALEAAPRVGNESAVLPAEVTARYRGRPSLVIDNLGPVDQIALRRADSEAVPLEFTPESYLPDDANPTSRMSIERCPASAVLPRLIVDQAGIRLRAHDGSENDWNLSTDDESALRSEYAARNISDRFLAHAAEQLDGLDDDFERVAIANPSGNLRVPMPNTPARWVFRVRAVDAGGFASAAGQMLQVVVRVPRPARGVSPELLDVVLNGDTAQVRVKARNEHAAEELFLYHSNDTRVTMASAELATVRNRPDLAPQQKFLVRDDKGVVLPMTQVTPGADRIASADFTVPDGRHFLVWALSVTKDGVPSRLVGPINTMRGYPPEID